MTRYLVTGASGLLGINFALRVCQEHTVVGVFTDARLQGSPFTEQVADLTQPGQIDWLVTTYKPDVILHTAAITNLDTCEKQPDLARRLNAEVPGELAAAARKSGAKMVHISTDAVFDGTQPGRTETDTPNPINIYAKTKLAGEQAVLAANPDALVARVNFYGWSISGSRSLAEWFYNNLKSGTHINGFTDVVFSPLLVTDLADTLLEMVTKGMSGLYHVLGSECISKYDFGVRLARVFGLREELLKPISVASSGLAAPRSPNLCLSTAKLVAALGHPLPGIDEGLQKLAEQDAQGYRARLRTLAED
jgi:dTDP-4-dehydrorhamnose reductase